MTPEYYVNRLKGQCDIVAKQLKESPIYTQAWLDEAKARLSGGLFKGSQA